MTEIEGLADADRRWAKVPTAAILDPWVCENSEKTFTEGNLFLFYRGQVCLFYPSLAMKLRLDKWAILRVPHARMF